MRREISNYSARRVLNYLLFVITALYVTIRILSVGCVTPCKVIIVSEKNIRYNKLYHATVLSTVQHGDVMYNWSNRYEANPFFVSFFFIVANFPSTYLVPDFYPTFPLASRQDSKVQVDVRNIWYMRQIKSTKRKQESVALSSRRCPAFA